MRTLHTRVRFLKQNVGRLHARARFFNLVAHVFRGGGTHILVTVDTFDTPQRCESSKNDDSYEDGDRRLIPVTVDTFDTPTRYESSKTMTVTRMATATRLIPVTVDTFDTPTRYESSKTMTVTRMATATCLILVTVDTFNTQI